MLRFKTLGVVAMLTLGLGACATKTDGEGLAASDPYENVNRSVHSVNVAADQYFLRPTAQGYNFVTPTLFKQLIGNGFSHLDLVNDFANYLLQADVDRSLNTLGRFTLNTVVGAGGLLDPASEFGLPKESTDFGLTLASYGVGEGVYLVVPFIGPSTTRDFAGFIVDRGLSPTVALGPLDVPGYVGPATTLLDFTHQRDRNADLIDGVLYESEDSYVTLRSAYLQRRRSLAGRDANVEDTLPDIFDDESNTN